MRSNAPAALTPDPNTPSPPRRRNGDVHVRLWEAASVGGDGGTWTGCKQAHTPPRLLQLSGALRGFCGGVGLLGSHAPDGHRSIVSSHTHTRRSTTVIINNLATLLLMVTYLAMKCFYSAAPQSKALSPIPAIPPQKGEGSLRCLSAAGSSS